MRKVKMYVSRNWLWIIAGLILTEVFVKMAYAERGYVAYGGEWLTLPLVIYAGGGIKVRGRCRKVSVRNGGRLWIRRRLMKL